MPDKAKSTRKRQMGIVKGPTDLKLFARQLTGTELLGRPFRYELTLVSDDPEIDFTRLIGQDLTIELRVAGSQPRFYNGFVTSLVQEGKVGARFTYHATLEPWTCFLTRRKTCRIFQNSSVFDILKEITAEEEHAKYREMDPGLKAHFPREYCVQYNETDFDFISRLLEEEGIYYYFEHTEEDHTMVLCDGSGTHKGFFETDDLNALHFQKGHNNIESWTARVTTTPEIFKHRDFDFQVFGRPVGDTSKPSPGSPEVYEYPGRFSGDIFRYPAKPGESGDNEFDAADKLATVRLEELMVNKAVVSGSTSSARGIAPGYTFKVDDHPRADQNTDFLTVRSDFSIEGQEYDDSAANSGDTAQAATADEDVKYGCSFTAIPAARQFRPARATPRPKIPGPQTATVVRAQGGADDVYADEFGRIRIQFHWDREDFADERHSCWVRVAQLWAGNGFGALFTPRAGQEVVVAFLDGDLDKPIVIGSVYNSANKPPYDPSSQPLTMVIKSRSSEAEDGFNEIRIDDEKDKEQILIHASRNQEVRVKNDYMELTGNDRHIVIENDKFEEVKNERNEAVEKDAMEQIGGDRHLAVKGKEVKSVTKDLELGVEGNVTEEFNSDHEEKVSNKYKLQATEVAIEASSKIELKVGGSTITMESSKIELKAGGATVTIGPAAAEVKAPQVSIDGSAMTEIKGGLVKIN